MGNVWSDDWDREGAGPDAPAGYGGRTKRLPRGPKLGATLYELPPASTQGPYHFHHGMEELLVVLRGRPTVRTPAGERQLEEGGSVHFGLGADGAHQLSNRTDEPVRYLILSNVVTPEVVEYPDSGKMAALARTRSQRGGALHAIHRVADAVGYFDGEPPR